MPNPPANDEPSSSRPNEAESPAHPETEAEKPAETQGFWQQPTEPLERQFNGDPSQRDQK